jgi:hypothetical protein
MSSKVNIKVIKNLQTICFYVACLVLLSACKSCKDKVIDCPGFPSSQLTWLPYALGDTINFVDSVGAQIQFVVDYNEITAYEQKTCRRTFPAPECRCTNTPPNAYVIANTNDKSRKVTNALGVDISFYTSLSTSIKVIDSVQYEVQYSLFDCDNSFKIYPSITVNPKDSLLASYTVGGKTYSDVVLHVVDTSIIKNANPIYNEYFIERCYYAKSKGIIAFQDLKTGSFFYRK